MDADITVAESERAALIPLQGLDTVWIQITGLRCNLACAHCFNSSGPGNRSLGDLGPVEIEAILDEAQRLGVREIAFTGGEPFLSPHLPALVGLSLQRFPTTVLTNGILLSERVVGALAEASAASRYSLELRISLDAPEREGNDAIRGRGSFDKALAGAARVAAAGLLPILTAARTWDEAEDLAVLERFESLLGAHGIDKARIKFLPTLKIGREVERNEGYDSSERVSTQMVDLVGAESFVCASARLVTAKGVWVCPILVNESVGRMGDDLSESSGAFRLDHGACYTCWQYGAICSNAGSISRDEA